MLEKIKNLKYSAMSKMQSAAPVAATVATVVATTTYVSAAGSPTDLIGFIIKIIAKLIIALGIIMFVMGLVRWASAHSEGDGPAQSKAIGMLAAAVMLVALSIILNANADTLAGYLDTSV